MKTSAFIVALLASEASVALAQCNADNVLRALQANSAKASPFCSTYTLPPPGQPLPTYVSQYPASRVSSGCSCLITPGPTILTTSTTSSPSTTITTTSTASSSSTSELATTTTTTSTEPTFTPGTLQCTGELVRNGGFQTLANRGAPPWEFAPPVNPNSGQESRAVLVYGPDGNNNAYVYYTLSFDAQTAVYGGQAGLECKLEISIGDRVVVYNGPGGDLLPFAYQRRTYTILQNRSSGAYALTVRFTCTAPSGVFLIDNISLVGQGYS
ncbi:MAG: hypothetical protein LQ345_002308 [Seirophora villosa]|nr:MAG: hypothetical protein LQ345_002308 [Seirophora villosa]